MDVDRQSSSTIYSGGTIISNEKIKRLDNFLEAKQSMLVGVGGFKISVEDTGTR